MSAPPVLFDRTALALRRARAAKAPADFLHRAAADQISERLIEVNRAFTDAAIIGPMARVWRDVLQQTGGLDTAALVEDASVLDLAPGSLDLVIHALALHWAEDPVGQLVQMRRALRPDGLMLAVLFGGQSLHELRAVLAQTEVALRGGLSPRVAPMGELRDLGGLLQRAGLALPVADSTTLTITYADLDALIRDLRAMGETNVVTARDRRPVPKGFFAHAAQIYAKDFLADTSGRIAATAELVFLTGWSPAQTQQQPLRPGSAQRRLADALDTVERPAGEATGRATPTPD